MTFLLLLGLLVVPMHAQDTSTSDAQIKCSQLFEKLTFDDVAYILSHTYFCLPHELQECELNLACNILGSEFDAICERNKLNVQLVFDYYSKQELIDNKTARTRAILDFFWIALHRLVYKMAFGQVIHLNQDTEEVLLFKNILTPRAFEEMHSWIQVDHNPITISDFPVSVQEKMLNFAKQLTFDESIMWLMSGLLFQSKNRDLLNTIRDLCSSAEDQVLLYQIMRKTIEQQELPERRALMRFLYSDQEIVNGYNNDKLLADAL